MTGSGWTTIAAAAPAAAAILQTLAPRGERGLARRIGRLLDVRGRLPEGEGRDAVDDALNRMVPQLAYQEDRRSRTVIDGSTVAAIVVVAVVGGGITWLLALGPTWLDVVAVIFGLGVAVFVLAGGVPQIRQTREHYPYENPDPTDD